jgi:hypothetical protein
VVVRIHLAVLYTQMGDKMAKFKRGDYVKAANGAEGTVVMVDSGRKKYAVEIEESTPSMQCGQVHDFSEEELKKG